MKEADSKRRPKKKKNEKSKDMPLTDTQKKIVQIAAKKFAKSGYQSTSLADIAKAVKISKGTLFYHYPSKEDLFYETLSHTIESAFVEEFEFYEKHGFQMFQERDKLMSDLNRYYDLRISKPKIVEKLWLEGTIEAEHNAKIRKMLAEKDEEVVQITIEMLKFVRGEIGILEGYNDDEMAEIVKGLAAFFRGMFLYKMVGKEDNEMKKIWVRTVYNAYISEKGLNKDDGFSLKENDER